MLVIVFLLAGCEQDEIDELRKDLDEYANRLSEVEAWQKLMNSHIIVLQNLINAKQQGKTILNVTPIPEGYTIKLSDGTQFNIYHGKKGETGEAGSVIIPVFGVRDSSDGNYYWTINGNLLRSADGKVIRANGEKGDSGAPGITPQLRINDVTKEWEISEDGGIHWVSTHVKATGSQEDNSDSGKAPLIRINELTNEWEISEDGGLHWVPTHVKATGDKGEQGDKGEPGITPQIRINSLTNEWEVSVNNGENWVSTHVKATGDKGDKGDKGDAGEGNPIFATEGGITVGTDEVTFKLADGHTIFSIPLYRVLSLEFNEGVPCIANLGQKVEIGFTLNGTLPAGIKVYAVGNGGWNASAELTNIAEREGVLRLTAPDKSGKSEVLVFLSDGAGQTWTFSVNVIALPVTMVHVEGGSLRIIGNAGRGWNLSSYYISRTEITNQQYCDFLNAMSPIPSSCNENAVKTAGKKWFTTESQIQFTNGRWQPKQASVLGNNEAISLAEYPMICISWYGAMAYCESLGGCLPTQAQWEYAARGSESNTPQSGNASGYNLKYAGSNTIDEIGWYRNNSASNGSCKLSSDNGTFPVGSKTGNYLGIYDMSGNVQEWCKDGWNNNDYPYPANGIDGSQTDPQGGETGNYRVICGGGWNSIADFCQVNMHSILWPDTMESELGFRLVYNLSR